MSRFAVPVAVAGVVTGGVSILGAVLGATVFGVETVVLLFAFTVAFTSGSLAYYSVAGA